MGVTFKRQARRERELEVLYEQIDRAWYSDDPEWQAAHRDTDAARAEQRAACEYQEQREREKKAYDLSTQAALDEKNAMRKALDSNNAVTYNKNTGEYTIAVDKLPDTGKWNVTTTDGKVVVDQEMERRFRMLSNVMTMYVTHKIDESTKAMLSVSHFQPIIANLFEAGLLRDEYGTKEYILNNPHTAEIGLSFSGAFGPRLSGTVGIAADCYGNVGLVFSRSLFAGGGTPGVSLTGYSTWTNAPDIDKLGGQSMGAGGSIGIPGTPVGVGADVVGFYSQETREAYYGVSVNGGLSLWPVGVPAEMHGYIEKSTVLSMKELFQLLYDK